MFSWKKLTCVPDNFIHHTEPLTYDRNKNDNRLMWGKMATILVYNNEQNRMETYYRDEDESMPYNTGGTLLVSEFRGSSQSEILWTERNAMISFNLFRSLYGSPIYVGNAFKRPLEGGHAPQSQHYAGLAFDVGQNLSNDQRDAMRNLAWNSGLWTYIEPEDISPGWVHIDKRRGVPACEAGYPVTRERNLGAYVVILQDGLTSLGFQTGGLDGIFGSMTNRAVIAYQESRGLYGDGIVGCLTWTSLMDEVVRNVVVSD